MVQTFAFAAWDVAHDPWLQFCGIHKEGRLYVGQQIDSLMAEAKKLYGW